MIVNGVIVLKDKNKYMIGEGLKLVKKGSGLTSTKGSGYIKCKKNKRIRIKNFTIKKIIFYYNI